jgi:hypothetical protein
MVDRVDLRRLKNLPYQLTREKTIMKIYSYIMTVSSSTAGADLFLTIRNITGSGRPEYGRSGDFGNIEMWIVPRSEKSKEELVTALEAVSFIRQVSVVPLSVPVTAEEVSEVRELFNALGWDSSDVKDEELSLFLNARLQGQYSWLLYFDDAKGRTTGKVRIIRAEEHPLFSPEWLVNNEIAGDISGKELTLDDVEIRSVVVEQNVEEPPPPPSQGGEDIR